MTTVLRLGIIVGVVLSACSLPPVETLPDAGGPAGPSEGTPAGGSGSSGGGGAGGVTGEAGTGSAKPPFGHPSSTETYPKYEGFTLWVAEDFDAPIDLDKDPIWTWSDGGLSEGNVRFAKQGISFADGKMRITADNTKSVAGFSAQMCSLAEVGKVFTKPLVSGEFRSRYNTFRYGRYEARLKAPSPVATDSAIDGNYISTMFVFRTPKFNSWRELDIEVTGDSVSSVTTNLLFANNTSVWSADIADVQSFNAPGLDARADFHTYAIEWLPEKVTWFIDGKQVRLRTQSDGTLPIPEKSAKFIMNLWIFAGGGFGGTEGANNQYPMHSEYDWVRFYRWDGDTQYPCDGMSTACLTADDLTLSANNPCDGIPQTGTVKGAAPCQSQCQ